jgi:hypothetical protein
VHTKCCLITAFCLKHCLQNRGCLLYNQESVKNFSALSSMQFLGFSVGRSRSPTGKVGTGSSNMSRSLISCICFFSLGSDGTLRAKVQPFTVAVRSRLTSFTTPFVGWICERRRRKMRFWGEESSGGRGRGGRKVAV